MADDRRNLRKESTDDSDRNEDARSTSRQIERAREYAARKGWAVDENCIFVDEAVSGAEWQQRHGFNSLVRALDPHPAFQVLIVSELSRIGRDTVRTPYFVQQIEEAGVSIWGYLSDQRISLADESSDPYDFQQPRRELRAPARQPADEGRAEATR